MCAPAELQRTADTTAGLSDGVAVRKKGPRCTLLPASYGLPRLLCPSQGLLILTDDAPVVAPLRFMTRTKGPVSYLRCMNELCSIVLKVPTAAAEPPSGNADADEPPPGSADTDDPPPAKRRKPTPIPQKPSFHSSTAGPSPGVHPAISAARRIVLSASRRKPISIVQARHILGRLEAIVEKLQAWNQSAADRVHRNPRGCQGPEAAVPAKTCETGVKMVAGYRALLDTLERLVVTTAEDFELDLMRLCEMVLEHLNSDLRSRCVTPTVRDIVEDFLKLCFVNLCHILPMPFDVRPGCRDYAELQRHSLVAVADGAQLALCLLDTLSRRRARKRAKKQKVSAQEAAQWKHDRDLVSRVCRAPRQGTLRERTTKFMAGALPTEFFVYMQALLDKLRLEERRQGPSITPGQLVLAVSRFPFAVSFHLSLSRLRKGSTNLRTVELVEDQLRGDTHVRLMRGNDIKVSIRGDYEPMLPVVPVVVDPAFCVEGDGYWDVLRSHLDELSASIRSAQPPPPAAPAVATPSRGAMDDDDSEHSDANSESSFVPTDTSCNESESGSSDTADRFLASAVPGPLPPDRFFRNCWLTWALEPGNRFRLFTGR